ncbi:MAG: hypothetical protein HOB52_04480 [Euryarchaeota archaeon]|jgi:hypothetical protein|nr:hypothetical protein [Euryarchaeota archaeon]
MGIEDEFWQQLDSWASPVAGGLLLPIAIYLLLFGSKNIKVFSFFIGCTIGFLSSSMLYGELGDIVAIPAANFTLIATIGGGVLSLLLISLVSVAVTISISLYVMFGLMSVLESNGYDLELELLGGGLFLLSYFMNRFLRKNVYVFGSAALGALMTIYSILMLLGRIPSQVDLGGLIIQTGVLGLFISSFTFQLYHIKKMKKEEEDEELRTVPKYLEKND